MSHFSDYTPRELDLISNTIVPLIIQRKPFARLQPSNLHIGFEQFAVFHSILSGLKPEIALEIGTFQGQTFSIIAEHSKRAISIDPDPTIPEKIQPFYSNAEFITATSDDGLPPLLQQLQKNQQPLEFVFLDGNHAGDYVQRDINNLLRYRPLTRTVILMHDSFNADCRRGMLSVDWNACKHCHFVDLDFAGGLVHLNQNVHGELWGGIGFALLLPEERSGELIVRQTHALTFAAANKKPEKPWYKKLFA